MQLIRDIYAARKATDRPVISVEFFPPKTDEGDRSLLEKTIPALKAAHLDYCSVTYGAGGNTRDKTLTIVESIQNRHRMTALAHLTCVGHTREQLRTMLEQIRSVGCRNILALRGDPPVGETFHKPDDGFEFAAELVRFIREFGNLSIGVAGFPEGHIACQGGRQTDWEFLKRKVEAGADFVITQLFFDNADYFAFRDHVAGKLGVKVPLVPGIIPILTGHGIKKFTQTCGARLPESLVAKLDALGTDDAAVADFGVEYATKQCEELFKNGAPGVHFYTLNKPTSTVRVLTNLGLTPSH